MGGSDRQPVFQPPLPERLLWFVGLWAGGVLVVAAVAFIIKLMIGQ